MKLKFFGKKEEKEQVKKSPLREWLDAIVFAVVAATLIRWIFMEAFTIPTPSMEKSRLVGDFLFVSKVSYGARTPATPLQIPLTHAKIWGTDVPSYLDWIQLPQYRLPAFSEVERNDVVVFNYPPEFEHPVDLKTHYIKRCIGIHGDVVEVREGQVYVNGEKGENPELMQYRYFIKTDQRINDRVFAKYEISEHNQLQGGYLVHTTPATAELLKAEPFIEDVISTLMPSDQPNPRIFPDANYFPWNADNWGPLEIPYEGMKLQLNDTLVAKYGSTIVDYEGHKNAEVKDYRLYIAGQEVTDYTFEQDYYFMMGDNRHNSEDSRFWGLVPADHVVGEAAFIWLSLDAQESFLNKIRWRRFFNLID
ncbi:MAG: signal peptidase I [Imperialibacter sp.]